MAPYPLPAIDPPSATFSSNTRYRLMMENGACRGVVASGHDRKASCIASCHMTIFAYGVVYGPRVLLLHLRHSCTGDGQRHGVARRLPLQDMEFVHSILPDLRAGCLITKVRAARAAI